MKRVIVRVPGKILLAGEYAVLEGHPSLSLAVDRYLEASLTTTTSGGWVLESELWQESRSLAEVSQAGIGQEPLLQVAEFARQHFALAHVHVEIRSELDIRYGLGSSTALRLGVLLGAAALAQDNKALPEGFMMEAAALAYRLQLAQQSFASGYDGLTQVLGGLVHWIPNYENWPGPWLEKWDAGPLGTHLQVLVGGAGAPTKKVGGRVRQALFNSALGERAYSLSDSLIKSWRKVLLDGLDSLPELCRNIAEHRRIFAQLPYFPQHLLAILQSLPGFDHDWTMKTTGAGGEDALLLIGRPQDTHEAIRLLANEGWHILPLAPSEAGARIL